jgi:hypothetical protein
MRFLTDAQHGVVLQMTLGFEAFDLLDEHFRIDDHAVADDAELFGVQSARWDQMQHRLLAIDDQGMTGIVAALKTHDDVGIVGKKVDDFAFAFVAPLSAYDCYVGHNH